MDRRARESSVSREDHLVRLTRGANSSLSGGGVARPHSKLMLLSRIQFSRCFLQCEVCVRIRVWIFSASRNRVTRSVTYGKTGCTHNVPFWLGSITARAGYLIIRTDDGVSGFGSGVRILLLAFISRAWAMKRIRASGSGQEKQSVATFPYKFKAERIVEGLASPPSLHASRGWTKKYVSNPR